MSTEVDWWDNWWSQSTWSDSDSVNQGTLMLSKLQFVIKTHQKWRRKWCETKCKIEVVYLKMDRVKKLAVQDVCVITFSGERKKKGKGKVLLLVCCVFLDVKRYLCCFVSCALMGCRSHGCYPQGIQRFWILQIHCRRSLTPQRVSLSCSHKTVKCLLVTASCLVVWLVCTCSKWKISLNMCCNGVLRGITYDV